MAYSNIDAYSHIDGMSDFQARRRHASHVGNLARQTLRLCLIFVLGLGLFGLASLHNEARAASRSDDFAAFLAELWPDAQAAGITRATFDAALDGVRPDAAIIALTHKQAEFVKPIWSYIDGAVSANRISRGQTMNGEWDQTLKQVEARYGVDRSIVLGVWGMETNFGSNSGNIYTIKALASLAFAHYRGDFFRKELILALKILQNGDVAREDMRGSWAGAMGQTQFMPSAFQQYAVSASGSSKRDIWSNVPDALASTANYLKEHGWIAGETWGYEVHLPQNYDFRHTGQTAFPAWIASGFTRTDGEPMPTAGTAALLLPAGRNGPAFLLTPNFQVIKTYNNSLAYALGVALLADRIAGESGLKTPWPRRQPMLSMAQTRELQRLLAKKGYNIGNIDGKLGEKAFEAVRLEQKRIGLLPDGYPTPQLLEKMHKAL